MASEIKNDNFITITGFMVNDLHLKGNELIVYACIYGFTQAENQKFTGSLQYLANWTNSTKQGVMNSLNKLMEKGLIVKETKVFNNIKLVEYYATKFNTPIQQSCIPPIQQSLPNNIVLDNIEDNIKKKVIKKGFVPPTLQEITDYAISRGRQDLIKKFYEYFTAGNWVDSKGNKVKNWKQKFITWENNNPKKVESKPTSKKWGSADYYDSDDDEVF